MSGSEDGPAAHFSIIETVATFVTRTRKLYQDAIDGIGLELRHLNHVMTDLQSLIQAKEAGITYYLPGQGVWL